MGIRILFTPETGEITCETASDIRRDLECVEEGVEEVVEVEGRGDVHQELALFVVVKREEGQKEADRDRETEGGREA